MNDAIGAIGIRRIGPNEAAAYVDALADVLLDCVDGGASVGFMAPLAPERACAFWRDVAACVARGERVLFVAEQADGRVVGTVQMIVGLPENQPHRADVAKMLVRRDARRQGVARRLLAALDDTARELGKTLLVLDTATGSDAERLYQSAGWQCVGVVPNYALMPDGAPCSTTFHYKRL
ncbi:GNAT family N-acetyltransferase [Burkholderia singularis]|uniref:GCN5-related N-acetyltransferase n=1 Tax=Burkholderia singularis TaxID=1503053 RepID=A0A238H8D1_9BURK|nr:GNAT family N-acetyltransferase [Burkholderia singularis]SMG01345.1 GCN5-related N-acetyltransferase [Burkholderia singularis]